MPAYSLYYYKQAHRLRPNDSRLITALGEAYEKLDKMELAQKCYERARQLGDIEGLAILRLAKYVPFRKHLNYFNSNCYVTLFFIQDAENYGCG